MATKIRLQRGGRKGYAFYRIVIADARAPRDGRFTEKIGTYNPNTNPATVDLNFDRALYWVEVGAQPTDTVRNILRHEGVYMMKHLRVGVKKGAFDEAEAQKRFDSWKDAKVKGDDKVPEISAASILAKTYRDEYMLKIDMEYPQYGWTRNMGYPTAEHRDAIHRHGLTPHHRKSFTVR